MIWLSESRFISYMMQWELVSREEAEQKWAAAKSDPDVLRRTYPDGLRVGVLDNPKTTGLSGTRISRSIGSNEQVASGKEENTAFQQMRPSRF